MVKKDTKLKEYGYIFGVLVGSILISTILGLLAIRPLFISLKETNAEVKEKKIVLQKLEANLENLKNLESKKSELEEKNQKVLSALPEGKDVPRLFVQMERIASAAGVQITSVSESGETTEAPISSQIIPLSYQISGSAGSYQALKKALADIEDGLRLITVEKMSIQGGQTGESLSINLSVRTFMRGQ